MPIRILIVDDSRDDAELTGFALRDAGLAVTCRWAGDRLALDAALEDFDPQLVLCDLNLPGWSGQAAMAAARDRAPAARFAYLTGALRGDEDLSAADAVVLKDDLAPLVALAQALSER